MFTDAEHLVQIRRVHGANYEAYGVRRVYKQLRREGYRVARCTVERLMRAHGIRGVIRGKRHYTTHADETAARAADLVERAFTASRPNELWVSDITYAKTSQGFTYVCFIEDVFSRRIVGWQMADHLRDDVRLHREIGDVPPAECEAEWRTKNEEPTRTGPKWGALHETRGVSNTVKACTSGNG